MPDHHFASSSELSRDTPRLRVLLVEDSAADAELAILTLEGAGLDFTYDIAATIEACQHLLQTHQYDVVLSDYRLPGADAYQTLALLKQSQQDIPLILVTGALGEDASVDCIKAGMTDYVLKDRLFRLPMVLQRSLEEVALRRQKQEAIAQLQQQARREAIINRIVQAMRGTLVLAEVLQTTADLLHDSLGVSCCAIFRQIEPQVSQIQYVSAATFDGSAMLGRSCDLVQYHHQDLRRGRSVTVDQANLPPELQTIAEQWHLQAMLTVPLIYQDQFFGGICLHQCDRQRSWTTDEINMVEAIADQCAIAIHQTQLFDQLQRQAQREQFLNQIGHALNSSLDPDFVLEKIVKLTGECFDVDRVIIFSLGNEKFQVLQEWRTSEKTISVLGLTVALSAWPQLLDPSSAMWCQGILHSPNYAELPHDEMQSQPFMESSTQSVLRVPVFIHDELFGGLSLQTTTTCRTFTPDEIRLLQQIADQAAIALYNAQSYERLEQIVKLRTQELEREKLLSDAANRSKSEFLTHMSHELRTPLTGILGFSSLLSKQVFGPLNSKQQEYVEGIASCGRHLLDLINDLLDLSKIEAGKEELLLEPVVIQEVCEAGLSMVQEMAHNKRLQLHYRANIDATICIADKRRLKQILFNLLSNAVKFTDSGSVTLRVTQTDKTVQFAVVDTGIGISEPDQDKLFQSFQQLDGGLDRRYEGTGLGLALARKLAQLHEGDITVTSELGHGSTFICHLPLEQDMPPLISANEAVLNE